jgi:hypothetical protein
LNLKDGQRASVALVALACAAAVLAPFNWAALAVAVAALSGVIALNRNLYGFFLRRRGFAFAAGAVALHVLYFLYGGLTYVYVWCDCRLSRGERSLTLSQGVKPLDVGDASRKTESVS